MAFLFSAAVHDYEHRGLSNEFLVKTADERAIRYADQNVNESHHVAAAFSLLCREDCNFLADFPCLTYARFRTLVTEMVMGTDMARSGDIMKTLNEAIDRDPPTCLAPRKRTHFKPATSSDAIALLQMAMKCCDLGHLTLPWQQHLRWVKRLEAEFFAQGDKEKEIGLPVSFLMDRNKEGPSQSQVGFFDFVVIPLFTVFCRAVPAADQLLVAIHSNYEAWKTTEQVSITQKEDACPAGATARAPHAEISRGEPTNVGKIAKGIEVEEVVATGCWCSSTRLGTRPARKRKGVKKAGFEAHETVGQKRSVRMRPSASKFRSHVH
eukprot:TRINITY_DN74994_c1_g1_i1.p1 TRINITY_DN74994_c1_g1~~TRINITY_DN74994_c1_g1_i1.p1  ORF type:complete len:323 (-),score=51.52 TRINITY_DN74994_c1_g1_i1:136-1104(-)